jgi:hypothetical protein
LGWRRTLQDECCSFADGALSLSVSFRGFGLERDVGVLRPLSLTPSPEGRGDCWAWGGLTAVTMERGYEW